MATELRESTVIDGKYRIGRRLAEGGMGVVFVAEHLFLRKPVALKVLHPQLSAHPEAVERFTVEARAASLIDHENVVRISDFGRDGGQLYLVMELLDGHDLSDELDRHGRLSPTRARFVACQMLRGLQAAHGRGVIHRDLKPENVFISRRSGFDDVVKILDFGIARMRPDADSDVRLTKDGTVMGTPLYMAPEQLKAARDVDARSDLYAVGVMLYEMLAGKLPYDASTFGEIAHAILEGRPRPLAETVSVDPVLSALVMKAFSAAREARFQSASELLAALERHRLDGPPGGVESPWVAPRLSQLGDVRGLDNTTVRDRHQLPMMLDATLDGSATTDGAVMPDGAVPAIPLAAPRPAGFVPAEEPALELDRPAPAAIAEAPIAPPAKKLGPALLAAVVVAVAAVAAGAYFLVARPPPAPSQVTIRLFDLPRGAHVFLDGAPSSASFTVTGDRGQHRVRLQAPGYADKGLLFVADDNQSLDGQMTRSR